jgi:glycosyltransferase involved in cell wall biosynthesis
MTLVSVCIPTRNQARYLAAAVGSALAQPVDGLEVLVHDDASTDATADVLAGFDDRRLRVRRHPEPLGIAANRNTCLDDARGRYIAWLDSDDRYTAGSLAWRLGLLEANPHAGLVHGAFELIDDCDQPLAPWPVLHGEDTLEPREVAFRELLQSNTITTSTVVARRSAHDAVGPFSSAAGRTSSDWEMWLRMALRADVAYTARVVASYRQHAESVSRPAIADGERLRSDIAVTRRVLQTERRRIGDPRGAQRLARDSLAAKALGRAGDLHTAGHRLEAAAAVLLALRLAPRAAGLHGIKLLAATLRGDDYGSFEATRRINGKLGRRLGSGRVGARLRAQASSDPLYERALVRAAAQVRCLTPRDARVATATKWDPTLLRLSRRRGVQFPDRRQMPDGYPRHAPEVVAHLELLRRRGITHLVFLPSTIWWLDHYPAFAEHLRRRHRLLHEDDDCTVWRLR